MGIEILKTIEDTISDLRRIVNALDDGWPYRPSKINPMVKEDAYCVLVSGDQIIDVYLMFHSVYTDLHMIAYTKEEYLKAKRIIDSENTHHEI